MKLYYAPGACSIGIHVLLEEIGKPYETHKLDTRAGETQKPEFRAVNPKGKVPTLVRDDGSVLTEFPAIAVWLARTNKDKGLMPDDPEEEARALEAMDYVVSTIHMQGFSRMFRPANFSPNEADHDKVKARGREIYETGLKLIDKQLAGKEFLGGSRPSIADMALFYVEFWSGRVGIELPANCAAHLARMNERPSVKKVMVDEGLAQAA